MGNEGQVMSWCFSNYANVCRRVSYLPIYTASALRTPSAITMPYRFLTPYSTFPLPSSPTQTPCANVRKAHRLSLLPNTKPPCHIIRTPLEIRLRLALTEHALHIIILRHLPPLIPFLLLFHDFLRKGGGGRVFDAVAVRLIFGWCFLLIFV